MGFEKRCWRGGDIMLTCGGNLVYFRTGLPREVPKGRIAAAMTGRSTALKSPKRTWGRPREEGRRGGVRAAVLGMGVAAALVWLGVSLPAEGLRLKDGMVLPGTVGTLQSLIPSTRKPNDDQVKFDWLTVADEQGVVRRFVPHRRDETLAAPGVLAEELFRIKQKPQGRTHVVQQVGRVSYGAWDSQGQRTATLTAPGNKEIAVTQGVTKLTPKWATVEGLTQHWKYGIATNSLPAETIRAVLHANINDKDHLQRLTIARFFTQARMFNEAERELTEILNEFPNESVIVEEMRQELIQAQANLLLDELNLRYQKGQYETVLTMGGAFPEDLVSGGFYEQVQELVENVRKRQAQIDEVRIRLSELESQLAPEVRDEVAAWRGMISEQLTLQTIDNLQSFLTLSQGDDVPAEELISLALSGWILGNDNAIAELPTTLILWKQRFLIQEYLKTGTEQRRREILQELSSAEGLTPVILAQLLIQLPALVETPGARGGTFLELEAPVPNDTKSIKYAAYLPPEYRPGRMYPVVIELGPMGRTLKEGLEWWAGNAERVGQAGRQGWIVVAPQYDETQEAHYKYSSGAHQAVIETLRDVRKRFTIDSNKVFLAGHGKGGEAAWDIGLSHPDLFAGVIPISAAIPEAAIFTRGNGKYCPLYIVGGELDSEFVAGNCKHVQTMVEAKHDLIYVEYVGHGREHFQMEIEMLFDWMSRKEREAFPKEFSIRAVRPGDTNYWWWKLAETPQVLKANAVSTEKPKVMTLTGKVFPTNSLEVNGGSRSHVISLSPELVDFEKRLEVRVGSSIKFSNFLKPSLEAMLEDFRLNGDRQRLVWARLEI